MPLTLTDIYGTFTLAEPVLDELLASPAVQRMRGIAQSGLPAVWNDGKNFSRYDHMVGVMLLLRKVGASLEEQIAGLLHDVSHFALSHMIDYVFFNEQEQSHQDRIHKHFISYTSLPEILERHQIPLQAATEPHEYSLLEQPSPDLCADRVDYTLRQAALQDKTDHLTTIVDSLTAHEGRLVFTTRDAAERFYHLYSHFQKHCWGYTSGKYLLLASAIRLAFNNETLHFADFYHDDTHVIGKLRSSSHPEIQRRLQLLDNGFTLVRDDQHPEYVAREKLRFIDPAFLSLGRAVKISEVLPDYAQHLEEERRRCAHGIPVRIVAKS